MQKGRSLRAGAGILSAVLLLILLWPRPAFAHAGLVRSEPPDLCTALTSPRSLPDGTSCNSGVILTNPPAAVHLWFSEPIQTVRHGLTVIAPSGKRVEIGAIQVEDSELSIAINSIETGTYQVNWQIISEDTHPAVGHFAFSVGEASSTGQAADFAPQIGSVSPVGLILQVMAHWLHFLGYALAFGPLKFSLMVLRPLSIAQNENVQPKLWRLMNIGVIALLLAEPLALLGQTGSLGSAQLFDPDVAGDILSSSFGRVLSQRLGAAVLLWVLLGIIKQGSSIANKIALGLGLVLAIVDGQASHAVSSGPLWLGLGINTIHLVAMGVWVGSLLSLVTLWNVPALVNQRPEMLKRGGRVAGVCLLWLIATGGLMAWLHLAQASDLFNSDYGKTILIKLLALITAMGFTTLAILKAPKQRYWWILETIALLSVLALAGLLVSLSPPA